MGHIAEDNGNRERLLKTREVAEWLNVGERTIEEWVAKKGLPAIRLVGSVRFDPAAVRAWIDAQQAASAAV